MAHLKEPRFSKPSSSAFTTRSNRRPSHLSSSFGGDESPSRVKPAYVFNSLSSSRSQPESSDTKLRSSTTPSKLKTTPYDPKYTNTDAVESFRYDVDDDDDDDDRDKVGERNRILFRGRYVVDGVLSTEGVTSVVFKGRDLFRSCESGSIGGIGDGARGTISSKNDECSGTDRPFGTRVVIKVLHGAFRDIGSRESCTLRATLAADPHDFAGVARFVDDFLFGPHFCIVVDFVPSSFSSIHFKKSRTRSSSKDAAKLLVDDVRFVAFKLFLSLGFFKWTNLIHSDLKPENILISARKSLSNTTTTPSSSSRGAGDDYVVASPSSFAIDSVRIIDFGNAFYDTFEDTSSFYEDFALQSPLYRAPEIFFGIAGFDASIDVWSVGAVLAEFYHGRPIFAGEDTEEILSAIIQLLGPLPKDFYRKGASFQRLAHFTEGKPDRHGDVVERLCNLFGTRDRIFVDFIARCLCLTPAKRLTPAQAAVHPFLAPVCPTAFLMEPHFVNSNESEVPYVNADLPRDYEHRPMKVVDAANVDPTFVRSFDAERVPLARKGRVLVSDCHSFDDNEGDDEDRWTNDDSSQESSLLEHSNATSSSGGDFLECVENVQVVTSRQKRVSTAKNNVTTPLTASELLAVLETEERRLDEAETNQESLKRKAANLELTVCSPAKTAASSKKS